MFCILCVSGQYSLCHHSSSPEVYTSPAILHQVSQIPMKNFKIFQTPESLMNFKLLNLSTSQPKPKENPYLTHEMSSVNILAPE